MRQQPASTYPIPLESNPERHGIPESASDGTTTTRPTTQPAEPDIRIIADGLVRTTPLPNGRLLVEIGRARYVKRFNLAPAEAAQLHEQLGPYLGKMVNQ